MASRMTVWDLRAKKQRGERITVLTAYDYLWGTLIDEAGIDVALVGDSLGMVVLGYETTLQVTMSEMISHTAAVARGAKKALIVSDMPFLSYQLGEDEAVRNAGLLIRDGSAEAVKVEGGTRVCKLVRRLVGTGIPVVGHLGLTPQSIHQLGGYKTQGTNEMEAQRILQEAQSLQEAGVCSIVLEKIPSELAQRVTESLECPTIGIGAGPHCDGQVLVVHDILGLYDKFVPPFAKQYARIRVDIVAAMKQYADEVKNGQFPSTD